jgi:cytochrome P450
MKRIPNVATWKPDDFNPHDPTFLKNPYPTYALFRQNAPVSTVMPYKSRWVFCYDDVRSVLYDTDTFVKNPPGGGPVPPGPAQMLAYLPEGLFQSDPPRHTELRAALEPLFLAAITEASTTAETIATPIIERASATGYMELVSDYALPVPASVLFTILGIPKDQPTDLIPADLTWPGLILWTTAIAAAHDITQSMAVLAGGATCDMALNTFYEGFVAKCADQPQDGFVGAMCETIGKPDGLLPGDVQACATDITIAGYLSTTFLIGTGILNLITHPAQAQLLQDNPKLISNAVNEMLRFDAPAQLVDRFAAVDTKLRDVKIPAGSKVTAVIGSANHDPDVFDNPDDFDIRRDNSKSVTFGDGIHRCIGHPLVAKVAPVAIGLVAARKGLQCAGFPQWQTDPYLRAVSSLPIKFDPS